MYKHKPDPLSQDENTVIEAFEYYYSHKEAFTIDQNGTVTISLNLLDGETNGSWLTNIEILCELHIQ